MKDEVTRFKLAPDLRNAVRNRNRRLLDHESPAI